MLVMLINDNIFNEVVNINARIESLKDNDVDEDALIDVEDSFIEVKNKIAMREEDPNDFKDEVKQNEADGDDHEDAVSDAKMDVGADTWDDGALQLKFVPDDSLLMDGLRKYFDHVNGGLVTSKEIAHKYIRDGVDSSELNMNDSPFGMGIYFATGIGYYTPDDLFLGVPIKHPKSVDGNGSSIPTKRFINYLNSDVKEQDHE